MLLKFSVIGIVGLFIAIFFIILAIRKLAFQLYNWFPSAQRVYEFQWQRKFNFYWSERADFSTVELMRLYSLWIMARFDKYFPVIDCEWQATKAQYFHDSLRRRRMRNHRYINPKSWPVFFMRSLSASLFSSFFHPRNAQLGNFDKRSSGNDTDEG